MKRRAQCGRSFRVVPVGAPEWASAFNRLPWSCQDVFYGPAFAAFCQRTINGEDEVLCALSETQSGPILYPFALRSLERLAGVPGKDLFDISGLYGRNGIIGPGEIAEADLTRFHSGLASFACDRGIVCGFDRFHPILANHESAADDTRIIETGRFIVVDLQPPIEEIEDRYKYSVRYDARKAERAGIATAILTTGGQIAEFHRVYAHTMERTGASAFYRFELSFFELLKDLLGEQALFFGGFAAGRLVSTDLILQHAQFAHLYLSGTLSEARPTAANILVKRNLIRLLKELGCKHFLLGGGMARGDSLERYKCSFAPSGTWPSLVGGRVFDPDALEALRASVMASGRAITAGRFQFYDPG